MNVILIVVDSLRADSLAPFSKGAPRTPFLDSLRAETVWYERAYATECWTLPTHVSMFTGLLPSEHGAHFQTMAYTKNVLTVAEILQRAGYHTEVVTRNSIFDGMVPGPTRGFGVNTRILSDMPRLNPLPLILALTKGGLAPDRRTPQMWA